MVDMSMLSVVATSAAGVVASNAAEVGATALSASDWWDFFLHFLTLSMLSIGGAITTVPDMHRYVVGTKHWLSDETLTASVALAQAAPGPNLLFVPVVGFQIAGLMGAAVALVGMLLPSTVLALTISRWTHKHRQAVGVRAFVAGMMPITLGLLLSTSWVLMKATPGTPVGWLLMLGTAWVTWRKRVAPVWLIAAGGLVGALGLI
jgi:chromate transporter